MNKNELPTKDSGASFWIIIIIFLLVFVAAFFLFRKFMSANLEDYNLIPSPTPQATATLTPATEEAEFVQEGNLTKPSMDWVLVYEKPGSPALQKTLVFDSTSLCVKAGVSSKCDPGSFAVGERVRVEGIEESNKVSVIKLSFN